MIKKNNQTIDKIYKGTTEIAKIYKGSTLVYENYRDIVATGNDIINITKAKAGSLNYLKAFGKCEQIRLPVGYTQVEYLESTGTQYIDTNFIPNQDTRIKVKIMTKDISGMTNKTVFGSRESATSKHYGVTMGNGSQNSWWTGYGTSSIGTNSYALRDTLYEIEKNKNVTILNGSVLATNESQTFTCSSNLYLFCMNQGGPTFYSNIELYYCKIWENGVLVRNMIPCKNPSNVVGMYDTVNGVFYTNAGKGTFTAGTEIVPTPSKPIPIWCNNGELKVSPNLFDKNNLNYIAGYLTVSGNKIESSSKTDTYYIECNPNTTYTLQREKVKTSGQVFRFASYPEVPTYNNQFTGMVGGLTDDLTLTITTGANDKYLAFSMGNVLHTDTEYIDKVQIEQGSTATQYRPYRQIYTDGTTETIKDSLNNTATAENLLSAGTYKDVQEVISGSVTRNVGIKVLDGTENWTYESGYSRFRIDIDNLKAVAPTRTTPLICTQYQPITDGRAIGDVPDYSVYGVQVNNAMYIKTTQFNNVGQFKQYLATQYANGTPVIIVYPLETPTTETVTEQSMNIQKGTNIIEVTEASLNDLEIEVKYKGK